MDYKSIEIFCGTGGVGKTTISTSRAFYLSSKGKKVLLITIDPAKRLRQLLNIDDKDGIVSYNSEDTTFDVLLLDCTATFNRIINEESSNKILEKLTTSRGGLNEILATIEIQHQYDSKKYDCIIVDTAPGKNFIDFLNSSKKINKFFNKTFTDAFNYIINKNKSGRFFNRIIAAGIEKFLGYLESVTGKGFINNFLEAISILYSNRESFLKSVKVQDILNNPQISCWYLVTSAEHMKENETTEILESINSEMKTQRYLIINKSWVDNLKDWTPQNDEMKRFKNIVLEQEEQKKMLLNKSDVSAYTFPDAISTTPLDKLNELKNKWNNLEK